MPDNDDKKKKKKSDDDSFPFDFDLGKFDINEFVENFMPFIQGSSFGQMIDEMLKNLMKSFQEDFDSNHFEDLMKSPFVYGFNIGVGPDGKPNIRQFGNVKPGSKGNIETNGVREPLIDVFKEKDKVRIIAEVPGINKGDVNLTGTQSTITIKAHSKTRKYEKKIDLPVLVKINTAKAKYNNGVLEVTIDRKEPEKEEGMSIDIE